MKIPHEKHQPTSRRPIDRLRHYLGDIVYGGNDGIVTTFTVVSGVEGAKLAPLIVIILGFVNLLADGFSMGASRYLSIRASSAVKDVSRGYLEPLYHAMITFVAFVICGAIPLLSFLIPTFEAYRFLISCILTGIALFLVGSLRAFVSTKGWLQGGFEMLVIGGIAALVAYGIGGVLAGFF